MKSTPARTIKLVVEYDGAAYAGWQIQPDCPTVQGELTRAVEAMVRHPVELTGAGRTDRGVHALGQVASFTTSTAIPAANFARGLNRYLPRDVAVRSAAEVGADFNARFSALGKHYRYTFHESSVRTVFLDRWTARVAGRLDVDAMREAGQVLEGQHDFAAFTSRSKGAPENTVRTVWAIVPRRCGALVTLDVLGRGFLYNMVRVIAGSLGDVGLGRRATGWVAEVLASADRRRAGATAPAAGLCLVEVHYDEASLARSRAVLEGTAAPPSPGWPPPRLDGVDRAPGD